MIRSRAFQLPTAWLALFAACLLVLLPPFGRLAEHREDNIGPYWAAMCTVRGLEQVDLIANAGQSDVLPAPTRNHLDPDCAYCPLLASIVVLVLWLAVAFSHAGKLLATALTGWPRRSFLYPCGLGSRGPPLAL